MSELRYRQLFRRAELTGAYRFPPEDADALRRAALSNDYAVFDVNLDAAGDRNSLYAAIARDMGFPAWFGHNLDALRDCLSDLTWRPAAGYLVFLHGCDAVLAHAAEDFAMIMSVFVDSAADWREQACCFWCLADVQSATVLPSTIADLS